jgi:hypothetical protein
MRILLQLLFITTLIFPDKKTVNDPPTGLMVEFIREPGEVKILDPKPEFSWIVPATANKQSAWQIILSSSESRLSADEADLWDSNRTQGNRSTEIEYSGKRLSENSKYYWKVRIWDDRGNISQWSSIQSFRTGVWGENSTTSNKFIECRIKPLLFFQTSDNRYFADFGRAAFGTLLLDIYPSEADTLIIHLGEKLSGPGRVDRNPGGTIRYSQIKLGVEPGKTGYLINLPRDERNTGPSAIRLPDSVGVITPFRYCEIENCNFEIKPGNVFQKAFWYYFDDNASFFKSSDTTLNKIWDLCRYSIKATSFTGYYVDGDRERIPYEADAYINQLGHYYSDREYSMARRTNEHFIDHPTWPTEWILQTPLLFLNDLMFTGNTESVARYYRELVYKTLYEAARPDGLISSRNISAELMQKLGFSDTKERVRDIVDWPPSQKDTGWKLATPEGERDGYDMVEINTVVNAFHYRSLKAMAEIAGYLGRNVDSALFAVRATKVKNAINEKLFDKSTGLYVDGESSEHSSLHANMMALAFDIVPDEYRVNVVSFIKSRGMACSVYGAQFLLEGLYRAGEQEYVLDLLTSTGDRSWYNMIRTGSTISMEAWDMKYKPNSDWNHAWGAAPVNLIPGFMWGIRPVRPGFSKTVIKPLLGRLTSSSILVPTIRGSISADYWSDGDNGEFNITIPGNMECDFVIDSVKYLTINLNGEKVMSSKGIIKLKAGNNKLVFTRLKNHDNM